MNDLRLSHSAALILKALSLGYCFGFDVMQIIGLLSGIVNPALRCLERDDLVKSKWEPEAVKSSSSKVFDVERVGAISRDTGEQDDFRLLRLVGRIPASRWSHSCIRASNKQEGNHMRLPIQFLSAALLTSAIVTYSQAQSPTPDQATSPTATEPAAQTTTVQPHGRSAGGDIGSGTGDVGKGAAKGVGNTAEGVGKGAGDLVTLHPIDAAGAVGTGAAKGGKDVVVGTAKGTGKIVKGTGKAIKHVF